MPTWLLQNRFVFLYASILIDPKYYFIALSGATSYIEYFEIEKCFENIKENKNFRMWYFGEDIGPDIVNLDLFKIMQKF